MPESFYTDKMLVIGGHSRSVGKTSLAVDLMRAFPQVTWTAVKITQYGHGVCSINGENCGCTPEEHTASLDEDRDRSGTTDTSRFLAAGARRALWLRAKQGRLAEGLPMLREALVALDSRNGEFTIVESNSLLKYLRPRLYLVVLDAETPDFKDSAREVLDRADAFVLRAALDTTKWQQVAPKLLAGRANFLQSLGQALPKALRNFVEERLFWTQFTH
ncbi:MAG: hypothetical protein ACRD50_11060 [Candidatus Acidiferrales bacterium]